VLLVAKVPEGTSQEQLNGISKAIAAHPNVAVALPLFSPPGRPDIAVGTIRPKTSGQDEATQQMIVDLREDVLPTAVAGTGIEVHVGGETAIFDDLAATLQSRLPIFIGVVLGLSFLLLMIVFRSIVVPIKAVIMNLLSIGAAYGIVVAVFQNGWLASSIGVGNKGPIESFVPMMMFAILFGLSMDYEVFLLSRIKEEYDRTGDNAFAVADGLSATARVITAAALIMVCVFGSFVFGDQRVVKEFGLGLAAAILIDASIVRMILVPATMELLGDRNWWFPKWLSWLPTIHVEGHADDEAAIDAELEQMVAMENAGRN
jgi:RND superfamily putative drug exporter